MAHRELDFENPEVYRSADLTHETAADIRSIAPSRAQNRTKKIRHVIAPFAQTQFDLTNNTAQKLPPLNGPLSEYSIHHRGPLELTWAKCLKFVNKIECCDVQKILHDSFKIQGCHYVLPRFSQFRVQIFQNKENAEAPFVVELQRRSGDAFLTGLLFKSMREFFADQKDNDAPISPIRGPTLDIPIRFEGLNLTRGCSDCSHWVDMLNTTVLETTRSGANALALATQSEGNIPNLLTNTEGIVKGVINLFSYSKDTPTLFGCSVILNKLSVDHDFCMYCMENEIVSTILNALYDWSGQGKRDVSSTQILLQLTMTLENIRKNIGNENWRQCLTQDPESLESLQPVLKEASALGQRLFVILFSSDNEFENHLKNMKAEEEEETEKNTTEDIGQN